MKLNESLLCATCDAMLSFLFTLSSFSQSSVLMVLSSHCSRWKSSRRDCERRKRQRMERGEKRGVRREETERERDGGETTERKGGRDGGEETGRRDGETDLHTLREKESETLREDLEAATNALRDPGQIQTRIGILRDTALPLSPASSSSNPQMLMRT